LFKIYLREKPDIILHFTPKINIYGAIAAKYSKRKCINTVSGLGHSFIKSNYLSKIVGLLYKCSCRFCTYVFFQNRADLEFFIKKRFIKRKKTVLVKGSGVDTNYFNPSYCRESKKRRNNTIFLLCGRLLWEKGIFEYISAAEKVRKNYPDTEFLLLGPVDSGNPSSISEEKINKLTEKGIVTYLGYTDDVRPYFCKSDIIVLPTYYKEGIPRSLLEALALGKPIITTNMPGCKEVVDDGKNGFIVPIKNIEHLVTAMIQFINCTRTQKKEMSEYSRNKALNEFSETSIIHDYLYMIKKIILQKNAS
ncbi:glycosyltransferase family 4 protein, partial [Chlamydiota bacterium]